MITSSGTLDFFVFISNLSRKFFGKKTSIVFSTFILSNLITEKCAAENSILQFNL